MSSNGYIFDDTFSIIIAILGGTSFLLHLLHKGCHRHHLPSAFSISMFNQLHPLPISFPSSSISIIAIAYARG